MKIPSKFTATSTGPVPHLEIKGRVFAAATKPVRDGMSHQPQIKLRKDGPEAGFGLYALPGGGEATANEIRAMLRG